MKLDRQALADAVCMLIGSAVGAAASAAFLLSRWRQKEFHGLPPAPQGKEPR